MKNLLVIKNLHVFTARKKIINNFSMTVRPNELHVLMGPNGSGKSTLAQAIMGHPDYRIQCSEIKFDGNNLKPLTTDKRARLGIFLGFQYPPAISGVSLHDLISSALHIRTYKNKKTIAFATSNVTLSSKILHEQKESTELLQKSVYDYLPPLNVHPNLLNRSINEGFSGGEKKKSEILQMLALKPRLALLDEPDSGLDADALRSVAKIIQSARAHGTTIILITHYPRILKYLKPTAVHVIKNGALVKSGGLNLTHRIELKGYNAIS